MLMHIDGFMLQLLWGMWVTIQLAFAALLPGLIMGLTGAFIDGLPVWLRYPIAGFLFMIRSLPELI